MCSVPEAVWDELVGYGLPLRRPSGGDVGRAPEALGSLLERATGDLDAHPDTPDGERKRESLEALLLALRLHYPSRYRRWFGADGIPRRFRAPSGRVIKLARIARAVLADLL